MSSLPPARTAFLCREWKPEPLKINPKAPQRGYLGVVDQFFRKNRLEIKYVYEKYGPEHDILWKAVPIRKFP
jgi:hypothetical protein